MHGRIILQDLISHRYLTADSTWVASCQRARTFEHTYTAVLEGLEHSEKTQVVWCFQDPSLNMYMQVRPNETEPIYPCATCPLGRKGLVQRAVGEMSTFSKG